MKENKKKKGFTIVEVLLTLTIIGVIIAILGPTFIKQWKQRSYQSKQKVFIANLKSAIRNMQADEVYVGLKDTSTFVKYLQKYMKLNKVCYASGSGLDDCFTDRFVIGEGTTYQDCQSGYGSRSGSTYCYTYTDYNYGTSYESSTYSYRYSYGFDKSYDSPTVGILTQNGVGAILTYDPHCAVNSETLNDDKLLSCISAIYDLNGFSGPNSTTEDIGYLNYNPNSGSGSGAYVCEGIEIDDLCWVTESIKSGASSSAYTYSSGSVGYRLPTPKELKTFLAQKGGEYSENQCFQTSVENNATYSDYYQYYNNPQDYYVFVKADGSVLPNGSSCDQFRIYVAEP